MSELPSQDADQGVNGGRAIHTVKLAKLEQHHDYQKIY